MKIEINYGRDGILHNPCCAYATMKDEESGWVYGESGIGISFEEARKQALSNLAQTIFRHERHLEHSKGTKHMLEITEKPEFYLGSGHTVRRRSEKMNNMERIDIVYN